MLVAECCVRKLAPLSAFSSLDACNATTGSDVQALLQVGTNEESLATDRLCVHVSHTCRHVCCRSRRLWRCSTLSKVSMSMKYDSWCRLQLLQVSPYTDQMDFKHKELLASTR